MEYCRPLTARWNITDFSGPDGILTDLSGPDGILQPNVTLH